jgi:hypothetical protein
MMKIKQGIVSALLFVFVPIWGCQAQDAAPPAAGEETMKAPVEAQTKEEPNTWDFGKIKKGTTEERVFIFTNETGKALAVTGINTSCGCTGTTIKDKKIGAGESTEVTVKFDSKGYHLGPTTKYIFIAIDDPKNPVIRYAVKIEVVE